MNEKKMSATLFISKKYLIASIVSTVCIYVQFESGANVSQREIENYFANN